MFSFFRKTRPAAKSSRSSFRPTFEALESREVMSTVTAGCLDAKSLFYLNDNHDLFYDHRDGQNHDHWSYVDSRVEEVRLGINSIDSASRAEAAFIRYTDGRLWECTDVARRAAQDWTEVWDNGVTQISASETTPNMVYAVFSDGSLYSHTGLDKNSGWTFINSDVKKVQATQYGYDGEAALILYKTGNVDEYWTPSAATLAARARTMDLLYANYQNNVNAMYDNTPQVAKPEFANVVGNGVVQDISASPINPDNDVFVLTTWNTLYRAHLGEVPAGQQAFAAISDNVKSMSADNGYVQGGVFVLDQNGVVKYYWGSQDQYPIFVADGVLDISSNPVQGTRDDLGSRIQDNLFMVKTDGFIWNWYSGGENAQTTLQQLTWDV